jgi:K+-transporting ATPase KdpF subunit
VSIEGAVGLVLSVLVAGYLLFALFHPERF